MDSRRRGKAKRPTKSAGLISAAEKSRLLSLFGTKLKRFRKERGVSLAQLSRETGIASNTLSSYESGKKEPKLVHIMILAKAFGVSHIELADIR